MSQFHLTAEFDEWLSSLKDKIGKARIIHRVRAAEVSNFGDCKPAGEGVEVVALTRMLEKE